MRQLGEGGVDDALAMLARGAFARIRSVDPFAAVREQVGILTLGLLS